MRTVFVRASASLSASVCVCAAVVLLGSGGAVWGQDADRVKEIQTQLAKLRPQVAALEKELEGLLLAGQKPIEFRFDSLKVGQVGRFADGTTLYPLEITEVINPKQMIVRSVDTYFLVRGFSTENLAEGQKVGLPGVWRITGTARPTGGRTYLVAEPIGTPKK